VHIIYSHPAQPEQWLDLLGGAGIVASLMVCVCTCVCVRVCVCVYVYVMCACLCERLCMVGVCAHTHNLSARMLSPRVDRGLPSLCPPPHTHLSLSSLYFSVSFFHPHTFPLAHACSLSRLSYSLSVSLSLSLTHIFPLAHACSLSLSLSRLHICSSSLSLSLLHMHTHTHTHTHTDTHLHTHTHTHT